MKNRIFIVAAILGLLATACKKENPQNNLAVTPITISASYGVSDGAKVSYTEDGNTITATWDAGDQLYVVYDGHVNTLTLSEGAGTASATFTGSVIGTPTAMSVLICYVRDTNNPSAVEVSATGEYTYTSGVFLAQDGTLASAAKCNLFYGTTTYGNGSNISCTFTPNTSMMKLTVFAPDGVSEGDAATLTYKSGTTELAKASFTVGTNGINTIYLTVPAGEYTGVQTLVYQSGEANVTETLSDTQAYFAAGQTYSEIFSFGNPIIPEGAINGKFTINSNGDQVYFSQGNLQYKEGTGWRFAEHQYDYAGTWNTSDWVDLFGWGTWGEGKNPLNTIMDNSNYSWSDFSGTLTNASSTGWRTLTSDEWYYVLYTRASATVNETTNARYAKAKVAGVQGIILFPDAYTHPSGVVLPIGINDSGNTGWNGNNYSEADFVLMQVCGAVFFPAAGYRSGVSANYVNIYGDYWSSSSSSNVYAHRLGFSDTSIVISDAGRSDGNSVRLVCNVQ